MKSLKFYSLIFFLNINLGIQANAKISLERTVNQLNPESTPTLYFVGTRPEFFAACKKFAESNQFQPVFCQELLFNLEFMNVTRDVALAVSPATINNSCENSSYVTSCSEFSDYLLKNPDILARAETSGCQFLVAQGATAAEIARCMGVAANRLGDCRLIQKQGASHGQLLECLNLVRAIEPVCPSAEKTEQSPQEMSRCYAEKAVLKEPTQLAGRGIGGCGHVNGKRVGSAKEIIDCLRSLANSDSSNIGFVEAFRAPAHVTN